MGGSGGERVDGDDESTEYDKETGAGTDQGNDNQAEDYLMKKKSSTPRKCYWTFLFCTRVLF